MTHYMWKFSFLLYLDAITAHRECISKLIPGTESPVCVCNASYCDTIDPLETISSSQYLIYTTSKSGDRLKKSIQSFGKWNKNITSVIDIDIKTKYQKIIGWGGAVTDAAGIVIKSLNDKTQEEILKSYFSKTGLEYNLVRVPVGGTDFSTHYYTYDDGKEDPELVNFSLAAEDFEYKIPLLKLARGLSNNTLQLLASAWFAPEWMRIYNNTSTRYHIKKSMYQVWVNYHIKFLKCYKEQGLDFWGVTTGNEPTVTLFISAMPMVGWNPEDMGFWIASNLGPTLENSEFSNITVFTLDDWRADLPFFVDEVFSYKNAKKYIQGIAVHWYADNSVPPEWLDITHSKYPDKYILYTEASVMKKEFGIKHGSWKFAEFYGRDIIQNLNHWSTGWIDWNIALDMEGGPTYIHNEVNAAIFVNASKGEFYKQPMYYILGHFSKFIPKGSIRVKHTRTNQDLGVVTLKRPDEKIVIVILNEKDTQASVTVKAGKRKHMNLTLMPKSIITVLY